MGVINIYNSISQESEKIEAIGKLKDILPNYDFSKAIILNSGIRLTPDYEVKENDIIFLRTVPSGATVAIITAIVAVVAAGVGVGVAIYAKRKSDQAKEEMEKQQRNAKNLAEKVDVKPFLKGSKNVKALGNTVQYQIGDCLNTPYLLTDGYYTLGGTDGSKQYWNAILTLGAGQLAIKNVNIGTSTVKTFYEPVYEYLGNFDTNSPYYDSENKIEIRQHSKLQSNEFKYKVSSIYSGKQSKHDYGKEAEPVIQQLSSLTKKVEVCIQFDGLRRFNEDNGNWYEREVQIVPSWSNDNGQTWHDFTFDNFPNNKINRNSKTTMRFIATKEFSWSDTHDPMGNNLDLMVKVTKVTPDLESNSNESCFVAFFNCFAYDNTLSNSTVGLVSAETENEFLTNKNATIGIRIVANESTQDTLEEINVNCCATAKKWNIPTFQWETTKSPTRNPASWILEVLTTDFHSLSKLRDDEIDLTSLGLLYEYCEENEFSVDTIITKAESKQKIIENILSACNAIMIWDPHLGQYSFVVDKKEEYPVALINSECINSIKVAKSFERKANGYKATFTNRSSWQVDTMYSILRENEQGYYIDTQRNNNDVITEVTYEYVTEQKHISKLAQKSIRQTLLQPREITVNIGREGDYYPIFSTVKLQVEQLKQGLRSSVISALEIQDNCIVSIDIQDYVDLEENKTYGIIVQAENKLGRKLISLSVKTIVGRTRHLVLETPYNIANETVFPLVGNVLSFGYTNYGNFDTITNLMKIYGIKRNNDGGIELTLRDYNEAIYELGEIPEYKSNLTSTPNSTLSQYNQLSYNARFNQLEQDFLYGDTSIISPDTPQFVKAMAGENQISLSCKVVGLGLSNAISRYEWQYKKNASEEWQNVESNNYIFNREIDGYPEQEDFANWRFRVRAVNTYSKMSEYAECEVDVSEYGTWEVTQPNVNVRVSDRTISLLLSQQERSVYKNQYGNILYKIQVSRYDDIDTNNNRIFYEPNADANPRPIRDAQGNVTEGNEQNYRTDSTENFVISSGAYSQVMPLEHQDGNEWTDDTGVTKKGSIDTQYYFKVIAFNNSVNTETKESIPTVVQGTALCTNIQDIVYANEGIKEQYIQKLSAISANIGVISQGTFGGSQYNYWALSDISADESPIPNEALKSGAFRVGGSNQYLKVKPLVNPATGAVYDYDFELKVGSFTITTTQTELTSDITIFNKEKNPFDRTKITVNGTYYQHRDIAYTNDETGWYDIAKQETGGLLSRSIYSNDNLLIANGDVETRRKQGYDIGKPYLSTETKVYHFDTNTKDQYGNIEYTLSQTGEINIKGREDNNFDVDPIDYTPAILAQSPYTPISKSLVGKYQLDFNYTIQNNKFTVDFWIQYVYSEDQVLCDIGTDYDRIQIVCSGREPNYNVPQGEEPPYNYETMYSDMVTYNHAKAIADNYIRHQGQSTFQMTRIANLEEEFTEGQWKHIAVTIDATKIYCYIGEHYAEYDRFDTSNTNLTIRIGDGEHTLILDELMIDRKSFEALDSFIESSNKKIPFGKIDYKQNNLVLMANTDAQGKPLLKTNIFEAIYPVGAIYLSVNNVNPSTFLGGTWQLVSGGRVLQGADDTHEGGSTIEAGLPNITGNAYSVLFDDGNSIYSTGCFQLSGARARSWAVSDGSAMRNVKMDANKGETKTDGTLKTDDEYKVYGKSNTVQPPAFVVYIWQRIA